VRHQKRARAGIEERARQSRQRFRPRRLARHGVAGRQHHPIGIEFELRHLACGQEAVVAIRRRRRNSERQRRLADALDVAGNEAMGREIDHAVIGKVGVLDRRLACGLAEIDVVA
jgi:hypothetical protein